ncbi:MAG: hypothetical protein AAF609_09195 [Cyanobacteria bacterium P01_C01_bin.120]
MLISERVCNRQFIAAVPDSASQRNGGLQLAETRHQNWLTTLCNWPERDRPAKSAKGLNY